MVLICLLVVMCWAKLLQYVYVKPFRLVQRYCFRCSIIIYSDLVVVVLINDNNYVLTILSYDLHFLKFASAFNILNIVMSNFTSSFYYRFSTMRELENIKI